MAELAGIVYAYQDEPGLGELVRHRTSASLPFCGRYRLIDFVLSSMTNAGVRDVGVIMQRDYQSLLDHLGSGKAWDLSRRRGGLRLLPPFGLPNSHRGLYEGNLEALLAVRSYVQDTPCDYFLLSRGDLLANVDFEAAVARHLERELDVTAVCISDPAANTAHHMMLNAQGYVTQVLQGNAADHGVPGLGVYIIRKQLLLEIMTWAEKHDSLHFREGLRWALTRGCRMGVFYHKGYSANLTDVREYFRANMDMLCGEKRRSLFLPERPVRTRERAEVSAYYGSEASSRNCLVADGCYIEGRLESCILSRSVRIAKGAVLKNCVVMQGCEIGESCSLENVILDKFVKVSAGTVLTGSPRMPFVVPKGSRL